jgi:hypothetical protein
MSGTNRWGRHMKKLIWGCLLFASLLPGLGRAELQQWGPNYFVAGVFSGEFEFFAAPQQQGRQRQQNWCWAATTQMVLNYHGLYVTQEQVVTRIFGKLVDSPAEPKQILTALSGWAPDTRGRFSQIFANTYLLQGSDLVRDLAFKWPLIVGLKQPGQIGHAYVLTAVFYAVGQQNEPIFDKVVLRDPWPGNPSRIEMPWQEFQSRVLFLARVYVNRL